MRVIAGLGNPGARYARTRHNVGFMVVRQLANRWNVPFENGTEALCANALRDGEGIKLILPQTFMNRSGIAVVDYVQPPAGEDLIVVHDDLDLPPATLRLRRAGGAGGHRGVTSIIEHCGPSFVRVRIGVGRPPLRTESADYVLAEFPDDEKDLWGNVVERAADAVECVLADGVQAAMNRYNAIQPQVRPRDIDPRTANEGDDDA